MARILKVAPPLKEADSDRAAQTRLLPQADTFSIILGDPLYKKFDILLGPEDYFGSQELPRSSKSAHHCPAILFVAHRPSRSLMESEQKAAIIAFSHIKQKVGFD